MVEGVLAHLDPRGHRMPDHYHVVLGFAGRSCSWRVAWPALLRRRWPCLLLGRWLVRPGERLARRVGVRFTRRKICLGSNRDNKVLRRTSQAGPYRPWDLH